MSIKNLSILLALTVPLMAMESLPEKNYQTISPSIMTHQTDYPYWNQEINELNNKQLSTEDANKALLDAIKQDMLNVARLLMKKTEGSIPDQATITKAFELLTPYRDKKFFNFFLELPAHRRPDQESINNLYKNVYSELADAKEQNQADEKNVTQFTIDQITSKLKILEQHVPEELKKSLEKK